MRKLEYQAKLNKIFYLKLAIISIFIIFLSFLLYSKTGIFGPISNIFDWLYITTLSILIAIFTAYFVVISLNEYKSYFKHKNIPIKKLHYLSFEDVFENENRKKIIRKILENPGIHNNELLRQCNLQKGQLQWHLYVLTQYGIIRKEKIGQYNAFFPTKLKTKLFNDSRKFLLKARMTLKILNIIEDNPGINSSSIARLLDLNRNSVKYHIDKLSKKNLIIQNKKGRIIEIFAHQNEVLH